jgi:hypothetical protein
MMIPNNNENELTDLLRELRPDGDGFRQPKADYFRKLGEAIIEKEKSTEPISIRSRRSWPLPAYASAIAAALLLLVVFWYNQPEMPLGSVEQSMVAVPDWEAEIDQIDEAEIRDYIEANIEDFDLELLAEDLSTTNL